MNKKTMTLEQYNKKYRNRTEYLIKLKKSDADAYNRKFEHVVGNQYLFNGRKWQLIGDTYYQIPRPISYTWFRNLHAGVQVATCALLGAIVVGGAASPLIINYVLNGIVVDSNEVIFSYSKDKEGNINANIKTKDNTYEIKSIVVKTKDYEFVKDKDYTYDVSTGDIKISAEAIKEHKGRIHIVPAVTAVQVESVECERTLVVGYQSEKSASNLNVKVLPENAHDKSIKTYYIDGVEGGSGADVDPFSVIEDEKNPGKYIIHANSKKSGTAKLTIVAGETNATSDCYVTVLSEQEMYTYLTFSQIGETDTCSVYLNTTTDVPENLVIPEYDPTYNRKVVKIYDPTYSTVASGVKTVTLPQSITDIDAMTFQNWENLTAVNFNGTSSLTNIGVSAFFGCKALEWFKISNNLSTIGNNAFDNCNNLRFILDGESTNFSVSDDKTMLFNKNKTKLISSPSAKGDVDLSIYSSLSELGRAAFQSNKNITSIKFPKALKEIPEYAFNACSSLGSVKFPEDSVLETIGTSAFLNCKNLKSIIFPKSLKKINVGAFQVATPASEGLTSATFLDTSKQWSLTKDEEVIPCSVGVPETNALNLKVNFKDYIWEKNV